MNFSVVFSVLLYILVPVKSVFYIEIVRPSVNARKLIEKIIGREKLTDVLGVELVDGRFKVVLFQCETAFEPYGAQTTCREVYRPADKERVYEDVNFTAVPDFAITPGHMFKIDGQYISEDIPQALTVGTRPARDWYLTSMIPLLADPALVKYKLYSFIEPLIDPEDKTTVQALHKYLSVNHVGYFLGKDIASARQIFARYVALLQKLINATPFSQALGSQARPWSPSRYDPEPESPPQPEPQPLKKSKPHSKYACGFLCSRSKPRPHPRSWSLRSLSKSLGWSRKSHSSSGSSPKAKSKSSGKVFPAPPSPQRSPPRLPPRPQSPPKSPPRSRPLSDREVQEAAGVLALKMFDPCVISGAISVKKEDAGHACEIYCQFISAAALFYRPDSFEKCEQLKGGRCDVVARMCVCSRSHSVQMLEVNMVYCHNALRLHIYEQAQNLSPER